MNTTVVHVPIRERNAWAAAIVSIALIGAFAWIVTSALAQPSPSGSSALLMPVSEATHTPIVVTATSTATVVITATAKIVIVTVTPSPTREALPCTRAQAGETCTRYPGKGTATPVPPLCSEIKDAGIPVTCRKDESDTQGGQVTG